MRRRLAVLAALLVAVVAVYWFFVRDSTVVARIHVPILTAQIGSGAGAVGVSSSGEVIRFLPLPREPELPLLPLGEAPKKNRLDGHMLEQALVLGAAPAALRPYVAGSHYGEDGIDVDLGSGIELRFGDASQAVRKWRAAAAVLANPAISSLGYVNVQAPEHPSVGGSGHTLPPAP